MAYHLYYILIILPTRNHKITKYYKKKPSLTYTNFLGSGYHVLFLSPLSFHPTLIRLHTLITLLQLQARSADQGFPPSLRVSRVPVGHATSTIYSCVIQEILPARRFLSARGCARTRLVFSKGRSFQEHRILSGVFIYIYIYISLFIDMHLSHIFIVLCRVQVCGSQPVPPVNYNLGLLMAMFQVGFKRVNGHQFVHVQGSDRRAQW